MKSKYLDLLRECVVTLNLPLLLAQAKTCEVVEVFH